MTGTRRGMTAAQKTRFAEGLQRCLDQDRERNTNSGGPEEFTTLVHGDCMGADADAHLIAYELGLDIWIYPGIDRFGRSPSRAYCTGDVDRIQMMPAGRYLARNHDIVRRGRFLVGFPGQNQEEMSGSGTWHALRFARAIAKPLRIVWPDGRVTTSF
jgi:hypothetical protein